MDLVWVLPWLLWSLLFGGYALFAWRREWPLSRSLARASGFSLAGVFLVAVVLALFGQLGVAGRF